MSGHYGEELRRLRRATGRTLADLADVLECSIAYMSDVERGRRNPPPTEGTKKLLAALGKLEHLPRMLMLAAKSRNSVEISVKGKADDIANMVAGLARSCDEGTLDEETARKIIKLLEKGGA
jgi:transcriptional regulator with XRE-family HTH domain